MDTSKKSRQELKKYFLPNAVPTATQFAELIDASLNQREDGIAKPANEPLSLEALPNGERDVLKLYQHSSNTPAWVVSMPVDPAGNSSFKLSDATRTAHLLIEQGSGALTAKGTINAEGGIKVPDGQDLAVGGSLTVSGPINAAGGITIPEGTTLEPGTLAVLGSTTLRDLTVTGHTITQGGITVPAKGVLSISGLLSVSGSTSVASLTASGQINANTLVASGLVTANGGLKVPSSGSITTGTLTASGAVSAASLTASGAVSAASLTVSGAISTGTLTASGAINANGGLTVPAGQTFSVNSLSATTVSASTITASGIINADGGLSVSPGKRLQVFSSGALGVSRPSFRLDRSQLQHIALPPMPGMNYNSGFTFQAWYYPTTSGPQRLLDLGNGPSSDNVKIAWESNSLDIFTKTGALSSGGNAPFAMPLNTWVHLAVTYNASTKVMNIFRNGVQVGGWTFSGGPDITIARNSNFIGRFSGSNDHMFSGLVSDVSLWAGAQPVSTTSPQPNAAGLIAYWPGIDNGAGMAADVCSNLGKLGDATMVNGASFMPAAPLSWEPHRVTLSAAAITQESLRVPVLANCTQTDGHDTAGFFKDSMGIVHLQGSVSTTGLAVAHKPIFTLPVGYRPQKVVTFAAFMTNDGGGVVKHCSLIIPNDGMVIPAMMADTTDPILISLNGISFRAYA